MDYNKALEKAKISVFLDKGNAAFLGSIMCSLSFSFNDKLNVPIQTNGLNVEINPKKFFDILTPNQRRTKLIHILWHIARLHPIRGINKTLNYWNSACDEVINLDMVWEKEHNNAGYEFTDINYDEEHQGLPEEALYSLLFEDKKQNDPPSDNDILPASSDQDKLKIVSNVTKAYQAAKAAGKEPGDINTILDKFLNPILDWRVLLNQFFTELLDSGDYSWRKPNRRYSDMYLPSKVPEEGRLTHLMYFLDVSGSVSKEEITQFNSEVKHIKETLEPEKLSVYYFDTDIIKKKVFTKDMPFDKLELCIGGGTDYTCVHDEIVKENPTAAIIFTDLYCEPMEPVKVPVLWICNNNENHEVNTGKIIRMLENKDD